jgi:ATP-binding cassette, subfamily B, bacterial
MAMISSRSSRLIESKLERDEIVETGLHNALLQEKGLYYAMWRQQIGERKKVAGLLAA